MIVFVIVATQNHSAEKFMKPMTTDEFSAFLAKKTNGLVCNVCGHEDWSVQNENGHVSAVHLATRMLSQNTYDALMANLCLDAPAVEIGAEESPETMADDAIVIRCDNCGHLVFFDAKFVGDAVHGKDS